MTIRPLSPHEARALGVLIEKALTVPDSYPLSLNSLTLGCNQKTARDPVLNLGEGEVQQALDGLKSLDLAYESSGSRVSRYAHNAGRVLAVPSQSVALLAVLLLRGPQTVSELRANSERLHRFADLSAVEGFLDELAARSDEKGGPLVLKLPRMPGSREARWAHLLCGTPELPMAGAGGDASALLPTPTEMEAMRNEHAALRAEMAELRGIVDRLCDELGVRRGS
jgi:uncharacterized protein YceH (UPF0502 family)